MDWTNERYVRLYTRDSVTWSLWPWEARALFCLLMRKVDRAGVLDLGGNEPARAVAAVVQMPLAVVAEHLPALVESGAVEVRASLVIPHFMEAQEASSSDAQRKRESRARSRDQARAGVPVTKCDKESQAVTSSHDESQTVTPSLAEPSLAKPNQAVNKQASPAKRETRAVAKAKPVDLPPAALEIAQYLYDAIRTHDPEFLADAKGPAIERKLTGWAKDIDKAMRIDGATPERLRRAIDTAHRNTDPFWRSNLLSGAKLRKHCDALNVRANAKPIVRGSQPNDYSKIDFVGYRAHLDAMRGKTPQ